MRKYLLPDGFHTYKANLHGHTTVSDGKYTPEEIKRFYKAKEYHAVAFTDHEVLIDHSDLTDDGFIALNGYEMAFKADGPDKRTGNHMKAYHLCLIATEPDNLSMVGFSPAYVTPGNAAAYVPYVSFRGGIYQREYSVENVNEVIRLGRENGFFVTYNHPRWSLHTAADYAPLCGLSAVEVYNSGCDYIGDNNAEPYDVLLRRGNMLLPLATDDNHGDSEMFGGYTAILAPRLSYSALTHALMRGDMYATTGPVLTELYCEDGKVRVSMSPAVSVRLRTDGRHKIGCTADKGNLVTSATLPIPDDVRYIRLEITDAAGKTAWTRAYFPEEFR